MPIIIDGTGTISGVSATGLTTAQTVTSAALPAGTVLQVIQSTAVTQVTVASTTFTDLNLSATITPRSATSKILIMSSVWGDMTRSAAAQGAGTRIVRGSTAIWAQNPNGASQPYTYYMDYAGTGATAMEFSVLMNLQYLDSPATTSATTYKIQGAIYSTNNGGSINFMGGSATANIILMEIAG
jgi:hypothetical protein